MQKLSQHFRPFFIGRFRIASILSVSLLTMLLLQVAGASAGSISQNPVYYACANYSTGKIYVIQQTGKCNAGYTLIQWNQTGPQGPQGLQGSQGPQGPQGPAGVSQGYFNSAGNAILSYGGYNAVVETAPLSAGAYIVTATEVAAVDIGDVVTCYVASVHSNAGHYYVQYGPPSTYQWATITVTDSLSVSAGDQIELLCADYTNDSNTYSNNAGISAIQLNAVGSDVSPKGQVHKPTPPPRLHH